MSRDFFFAILQDIYCFYLWIELLSNETRIDLYNTPIEEFADQMIRRVAENFPNTEELIPKIFHWFWVDYCAPEKMDELWEFATNQKD